MAGLTATPDFGPERRQLLRYLIVGAANTAFAYAIYAVGISLGLSYQLASLGALIAGICSGFIIQGKVAFRSQLENRFLPFVALWVLLYLANIVLIGTFAFFGTNLFLAGLLAAVPVNAASYLAMRAVIFTPKPPSIMRMALLWFVAFVFIARLHIVTHLSLNWDEFLNLSMLYDFRRGEMTEIFQTAFIHLFHWLPLISANEVDQLVAARIVILACTAFTSFAIYHAARRFMAVDPALVAVLAYNCFGASLLYGTDFRTDTLATAAMSGAMALATHRRATWPQMIAIGVLISLGGALTIKSVFFLPTIGVLVLTNAWAALDRARTAKVIVGGAAVCVVTFAAILGLHAASLAETSSASAFLGRTSGATMLTGNYGILSSYWLPAVLGNLGFWILVVTGITSLVRKNKSGADVGAIDRLALSAFALPALVPLIYSEVYPYFHAFLIAPVAVLAGFGFVGIREAIKPLMLGLLLMGAVNPFLRRMDDGLAQQRFTLAVIHRLFPDPVPYIDHTSMVSSFPKKGFFMSRWGVTDYRETGDPVMAEILREDQPVFLLETRELLAVDRIAPEDSQQSEFGLFGPDVKVLRDNYIRYWGPLFLPGKVLADSGRTRMGVSGIYRVEGDGRLTLNGKSYSNGDTVRLAAGDDFAYSSDALFRLVWAAPPPPAADPPLRLFSGW